jgi:hypothetical protein
MIKVYVLVFGQTNIDADLSTYDLSILGNGIIVIYGSGYGLGVGSYGGNFNLELDKIECYSENGAIINGAANSNIAVKEIYMLDGRTAYSSWVDGSLDEDYSYNRIFRAGYIEMHENATVSRASRFQPSGVPLDSIDYIEIDNVVFKPGTYAGLSAGYFQTNNGSTNCNYVYRLGSVRDYSNNVTTLIPYTSVSNDAGGVGAAFVFGGGASAGNDGCTLDINIGAAYMNRQVLSLQGAYFSQESSATFIVVME